MSWTVACFCGNVYSAPPDRCEACGRSIDRADDDREAFPDLAFGGTADLEADGDIVVRQHQDGEAHTAPASDDLPDGSSPAGSGEKMQLRLDDGATALQQLGLIPQS